MAAQFGVGIQDEIDAYYQLGSSAEKDGYLQLHPEVKQAFDYKNQYVLTTPVLNKYYGGISVLEQYYTSQMYAELEKQYGDDIQAKWDEYDVLQLQNSAAARAYKKQHPELAEYTKTKNALRESMMRIIADLGSNFPDSPQVPLRTDITNPSQRQEDIINASQPQEQLRWSDWQMLLSDPMQQLILDYWTTGEALPSSANYQLDYIASQIGMYDGDEVLQNIGIAIAKQNQP